MSQNNSTRWTSDHLTKPGGTALYAAQQRERLRQMADEVQALLREYRADLESMRIDGDRPLEAKLRAFFASRPLARLEKDLRSAVNEAGKLDKEFQRRYVELPVRRKEKAEAKALEKDRKAGLSHARAMNTSTQIQGISQGIQETVTDRKGIAKASPEPEDQEPTFLDFLRERA